MKKILTIIFLFLAFSHGFSQYKSVRDRWASIWSSGNNAQARALSIDSTLSDVLDSATYLYNNPKVSRDSLELWAISDMYVRIDVTEPTSINTKQNARYYYEISANDTIDVIDDLGYNYAYESNLTEAITVIEWQNDDNTSELFLRYNGTVLNIVGLLDLTARNKIIIERSPLSGEAIGQVLSINYSGTFAKRTLPADPLVLSAFVLNDNPDSLFVAFDKEVDVTNTTDITLPFVNGTPKTITGVGGSGNDTLTFTLSGDFEEGDTAIFTYGGSNTITSTANGLGLEAGSDTVVNNVASVNYTAYYDFAGDYADASGNYSALTNSNATIYTGTDRNGLTNNAADLDGTASLSAPSQLLTDLKTYSASSFSMWVRMPDVTPSSTMSILSFGDTDNNNYIMFNMSASTGVMRISCVIGGVIQYVLATDANNLSTDTWHNVIFIHNGTQPTIYVDGVAVAQTFSTDLDRTAWIPEIANLDNIKIGTLDFNAVGEILYYTGQFDDWKIFDHVLTSQEIADLNAE